MADAVAFALTSGILSHHADEVAMFLDTAEAGVLCVNRRGDATTGAWPGVQAFWVGRPAGVSAKEGWARTTSGNSCTS